ncbi:hypothetical protein KA107_01030 [Candidatus Pacearchaeota archaeon]|nr:hypothetical protein [Candidatus Pacearchaeota archaeon]
MALLPEKLSIEYRQRMANHLLHAEYEESAEARDLFYSELFRLHQSSADPKERQILFAEMDRLDGWDRIIDFVKRHSGVFYA